MVNKHFIIKVTALVLVLLASVLASANSLQVRWEDQKDISDDLSTIISRINQQSQTSFLSSDFVEIERRDLATSKFTSFRQMYQGIPVKGQMIRTWKSLQDGHLIQMEALLEVATAPMKTATLRSLRVPRAKTLSNFLKASGLETNFYVRKALKNHDDSKAVKIRSEDIWVDHNLVKEIYVDGVRGTHQIQVSYLTKKIILHRYKQFPRFEIPARVFPIYEETSDLQAQTLVPVYLKNLLSVRKDGSNDPYRLLKNKNFFYSKYDDWKATTPEGRAQGYWSSDSLGLSLNYTTELLPVLANSPDTTDHFYLIGKYATVQIHPSALKLPGIKISLNPSVYPLFDGEEVVSANGVRDYRLALTDTYLGRALMDSNSAFLRLAQRSPQHDPVEYLNEGFDEVQVYYAIDTLMTSLQDLGFTDSELSTRAFHAYLYNTDISMRDNAFYTSDTINFTTYSADQQNMARDNTTIWHELGHGIMDRLMGPYLDLDDTGGLSEGMADFVAQIIVEKVTAGQTFAGKDRMRIFNNTGFYLTNETHDDGEAYGGSMNSILIAATQKWGQLGTHKVADLILETMRYSRNHPRLTANEWFEHMYFADRLGHGSIRAPNELKDIIKKSLNSRNFGGPTAIAAQLSIFADGSELTSSSVGSRENSVVEKIGAPGVTHNLQVTLKDGTERSFNYPARISVEYAGGPLQGAVKWKNKALGSVSYTVTGPNQVFDIAVSAETDACEFANHDDGGCGDYVYLKVFENGNSTQPVAKKRFYVRLKP